MTSLDNNTKVKKRDWSVWIFLLPTILLLGFWVYKPLIQTVIYAFYSWNMIPGTLPEYVGLENFANFFSNPEFKQAMGNTFYYIITLLPFSVVLPLIVSALIQDVEPKFRTFYRVIIFMPMIMPPVVNAIIFQWLFHQTNGLVNYVLVSLGIFESGKNFFMDPIWARRIITLITGWKMFAYSSIIYSGSIGMISKDYYEAAEMDRASKLKQFLKITVPMLSPQIMLMLMMSVLFASQWTFNYVESLTAGGPYGSTTNFYYLIYKNAFLNSNIGASAASSLVFLLLFGTISLLLLRMSKKLSFYDN